MDVNEPMYSKTSGKPIVRTSDGLPIFGNPANCDCCGGFETCQALVAGNDIQGVGRDFAPPFPATWADAFGLIDDAGGWSHAVVDYGWVANYTYVPAPADPNIVTAAYARCGGLKHSADTSALVGTPTRASVFLDWSHSESGDWSGASFTLLVRINDAQFNADATIAVTEGVAVSSITIDNSGPVTDLELELDAGMRAKIDDTGTTYVAFFADASVDPGDPGASGGPPDTLSTLEATLANVLLCYTE